jgi:hypothetical protein
MKASKKIGQLLESEPLEAVQEFGHATIDTVKAQSDASIDALWNQLLGAKEEPKQTSGDLQEGQAIDFTAHKKKTEQVAEKPRNVNISAGIDYHADILHGEKRISSETEQMLSRQIEEITVELRKLVNASTELAIEFKDVAVEQHITKPGKYHVSLFSFVLSIVRQARVKVESSNACLSIAKGRKQKQGYWDRLNEEGTSFSQNNERAIATQAG